MLSRNAHKFQGWRMYVDHETDAERKARGGLPRSVRDIGGVVLESHWDPSVPAEGRFGAGAVVGTVRPIKQVGDLVELHPSLVESSINAHATAVKPVMRDGSRAWLVEGIEDKGSVDWVTEGGAGGKVVSLLEAVDGTQEEQEMALLEALTDEEFREYVRRERPGILEADSKKPGSDDGSGDGDGDDAYQAEYDKLVKSGLPPKLAAAAAKKHVAKMKEAVDAAADPDDTNDGGGDVAAVTKEDAVEAVLQSSEVKDLISDLVEAAVEERLQGERATVRAQAYTDAHRQIELRDMRDLAQRSIMEARLPKVFEDRALAQFAITEDGPARLLDVYESYDDDGNITQTAETALRESIESVISESRALLAAANPTRVTRQGPQSPAGDGKEGEAPKVDSIGGLTRELLTESHIDPDKAFASERQLRG